MTNVFRKAAIAIVAVFIMSVAVSAQSFVKGDHVAGASIGFGGGYYSGNIYSSGSQLPVISLYYENFVKDNLWDEKSAIGVGGMLGYTQYSADAFKVSHIIVGPRAALHYAFIDKLDTYAGLFLGYDIVSSKWEDSVFDSKGDSSAFDYAFFTGARYYFTDAFAVMAEVGVGLAPLNVGVSYKF